MRKGSSKLIGQKFGTLEVLSVRRNRCTVKCDCGNEYERKASHLPKVKHPTCPDCKAEINGGNAVHPLYRTWSGMKTRCNNPNNKGYESYGGRGIKVCARWNDSFKSFVEDMGSKPEGYSIDRIDNDGDYEPSNCRWASMLEQGNNRRTNVYVTYLGQKKTVVEWCRELGILHKSHYARLSNGMTHEEAFDYHVKKRA